MATPRKTPQDRQPPAQQLADEAQARLEDIEGHELLRPLSKVKGSDQTRLLARLERLGLLSEDERDGEAKVSDLDLDQLADLIDYVAERFALDTAAFDDFTCGAGGYQRALTLVMGYAAEMGKGVA